jgi:hypothetical protein
LSEVGNESADGYQGLFRWPDFGVILDRLFSLLLLSFRIILPFTVVEITSNPVDNLSHSTPQRYVQDNTDTARN